MGTLHRIAGNTMNREESSVFTHNEALYSTLEKLYLEETGDPSSSQISCIIKRANLPTPVLLGGIYLAIVAREKAAVHMEALRKEILRDPLGKELLQKRLDAAIQLCGSSTALFSVSLIISSKYLVDRAYVNRTWSNILMMDKLTINEYERTLLSIFEHKVDITERSIMSVVERLKRNTMAISKKEGKLSKLLRKITSCLFSKK